MLCYLVLLFAVYKSKSHCTNGICEKVSFSLATDTKQNFALVGYVIEKFSSLWSWQQCFNICLKNCQCLSFNFIEVNTTENCELNDANTKLAPEALREKEGVVYYEPVRNYYDKNGVHQQTCSDPDCKSHCCDSAPCQYGGTCRDVCDVSKRRYNCTCLPGFMGHRCQFPPRRSCNEIMTLNKVTTNGIYHIVDEHSNSFPVYCDFGSEPGFAWTLIQSHSLQNNDAFKDKAFYLHDMPINQDAHEWDNYRLSMSRMQSIRDVSSHWRATCNFPTDGVDYRDYIRVSLESLDLLVELNGGGSCMLSEYINIRGNQCTDCTVWAAYNSNYGFHVDHWYSSNAGCDLTGGIKSEDSFGFYHIISPDFRCTSSMSSTTQYWLGSL
ncbi:hypothetical protein ACROYT_G026152 [Oculina patagonica]